MSFFPGRNYNVISNRVAIIISSLISQCGNAAANDMQDALQSVNFDTIRAEKTEDQQLTELIINTINNCKDNCSVFLLCIQSDSQEGLDCLRQTVNRILLTTTKHLPHDIPLVSERMIFS